MPTTYTLRPLADTYLRGRVKRGELTRDTAKNHRWVLATLYRSYGNRPPGDLSRRAIDRWLEDIGHMAVPTRRNAISTVRGFTAWLQAEGIIRGDPLAGVARPKQPRSTPRAITSTEVSALFDACPDQRGRVIVALMVGCGLRCVEVSRLSVRDWDPDLGTLSIVGKGGHQRVLPVPQFVTDELDQYVTGRGPLIRQIRKPWRGLDAGTISIYVGAWFKEAGIKGYRYDGRSAHALRHTAASDVLDNCGDLRVVQEMLGHTSIAVTSVYLRRAQLGQMREAMENRDYRPHDPPLKLAA